MCRGAEIWPCPAHVHVETHKSEEMLCLSNPFHCKRSSRLIVPQDMYMRRFLKIEYLNLDYKQELAFCQLKEWEVQEALLSPAKPGFLHGNIL